MANSTTTPGGTVLTVPANKIWAGSVGLCATLAVTVGGSAATSFPEIVVSGSGASWADGDVVLKLALFVPAVGVTAVTGSQVTATLTTGPITVQTRDNPITLIMNHGSGVTAAGTAIGEVL
jgi:hypothetical protein